MSFLKKFGLAFLKGAAEVLPFGSVIEAFIPDENKALKQIVHVAFLDTKMLLDTVMQVEAIGQAASLTKEQKLAAATPIVTNAFLAALKASGHKIADEERFKKAMVGYVQATVDLADSLDEDGVKS